MRIMTPAMAFAALLLAPGVGLSEEPVSISPDVTVELDGTVVAVKNELSPGLVLLSVGADDKVEAGFRFSVYRGF